MKTRHNTRKALFVLFLTGILVGIPSMHSEAAVITSNATDKIAVVFHENTAYSAGDYIIYDGEMYICTEDIQGTWAAAEANFMQITKNHEIGMIEDLSAVYDDSKDPSEETSFMAFAANAWHKLKGFFGLESKDESVDVNHYKNASVSAKLNFLQQQNQQLDQNVANLQGWITQSFSSVSNGKSILAATITDKGVPVGAQDSFVTFNQAIKDLALLQYQNGQDKGREDGLKEGQEKGYDQGYKEGVTFADHRVNEDSESYKKGLSVFDPKVWSIEIRVDKNGPDKEEEFFSSQRGMSDNHIEYSYLKNFEGHTIIAVYMDNRYYSPFGGTEAKELVSQVGNEYLKISNARSDYLKVTKESIFWGYASFNKEDDTYNILKLKVVYV